MEQAPDEALGGLSSLDGSDPRVVSFLGAGHPAIASFAAALAEEGVLRGLLGPREVPRLWERHLLNSAAVAQLLPEEGTLVDVGSGAGLPGVVLAALRPGMRVVLLEPMERRVLWLEHVRTITGLENLEVRRGRAEDLAGSLQADVVTARAVAPLDRLAGWTLPLLVRDGVLLALKGQAAAQELETAAQELARFGGDAGEVLSLATIPGVEPTTVVRVVRREVRGELMTPAAAARSKGKATSRGRRAAPAPSGTDPAGAPRPGRSSARSQGRTEGDGRDGRRSTR